MSLTNGRVRLQHAIKQLKVRWEIVKEHWHDEASRKFEEDYMDPIDPEIIASIQAIDRLDEIFARAKRDCS